MKRTSLYILFFSLMIFISSCGNGLSEEEKNTIEKFEVEWTANIDFADYYFSEIIQIKDSIQKKCCGSDTLPENSMGQLTHISFPDLEKLKNNYQVIKKSLDKENQNWLEIKQKAMQGEMGWSEVESVIEKKREVLETTQKEISAEIKRLEKIKKENL